MSSRRRRARELALQILFQSEFLEKAPWHILPQFLRDHPQEADVSEYAKVLACGVWEHKAEIDGLIEAASHHWKLSRMGEIDRNVLRLATYEIRHVADVPREVSLNEAIEIAKKYGSEDSASFVNGILDTIKKEDA